MPMAIAIAARICVPSCKANNDMQYRKYSQNNTEIFESNDFST